MSNKMSKNEKNEAIRELLPVDLSASACKNTPLVSYEDQCAAISNTCLKAASGLRSTKTMEFIAGKLGFVTDETRGHIFLTEKGKKLLYYWFSECERSY